MRYWKIIGLLIIIVFGIGTYYIQNALAESTLPEVKLEMIHGDEEEVQNLIILASLLNPRIGSYDNVRITNDEEALYASELSYFDEIKGNFYDPITANLKEKYRSFMRGKDGYGTLFESDENIIHVGPFGIDWKDDSFEIEILDKNSNKVTSFQVKIPEKTYQYMNVIDVQVNKDELSVMTRNHYPAHSDGLRSGEEFHIYRISLEDQTIISHEAIYEVKSDESDNRWSHINEVNNYYGLEKEDYFVFQVVYVDENKEFEDPTRESSEYFAYHYETAKLIDIDVPSEVTNSVPNGYVDGSTLYFLNTMKKNLQIIGYSIDDGDISTIDIPTSLELFYMNTHGIVENGKMYIPSSGEKGNHLLVVDLQTGKLLYEGKLITDINMGSSYFDIYDVIIK